MSTLYVDNLQPNLGSRVLIAGHVVHVASDSLTNNGVNISVNGTSSYGDLSLSFTRKSSTSIFIIQMSSVVYRASTSGEARIGYRIRVNGGAWAEYQKYAGDDTAWNRSSAQFYENVSGSAGDLIEVESWLQNTAATDNRFRTPDIIMWEIAQ